jgi:alpha-beta hydrolase superfamily lysophospholipase
MDGYLEETY